MRRLLFFLVWITPFAWAQPAQESDASLVHEAFIARVRESTLLQAVPKKPPASLMEHRPPQPASAGHWIPGYWDWAADQFVWVPGVWRQPPPGRKWMERVWVEFAGHWVRLPGFWADSSKKQLTHISIAPPEPPTQFVDSPGNGYFWIPGYWRYNEKRHEFDWYEGTWQPFDSEWVYVPARYLWRPDGYFLVEGYWDHPLEDRGAAYPPLVFELSDLPEILQQTDQPMTAQEILIRLFPDASDALHLYHHSYQYLPGFWAGFYGTPPWWRWASWWGIGWTDQWALFWWWSHPGYPQPDWMTTQIGQLLWGPSNRLVGRMRQFPPPPIVTPDGVVAPEKLRRALAEHQQTAPQLVRPILPAPAQQLAQLVAQVRPKPPSVILRPKGQRAELEQREEPPPRPLIGGTKPRRAPVSKGRVRLPNRPSPAEEGLHRPSSAPRSLYPRQRTENGRVRASRPSAPRNETSSESQQGQE